MIDISYMNAINLEVNELAEAGLIAIMTGSQDDFGEEITATGWISPTAAQVALRALREGDLVRVAAILTPTPQDPLSGAQEACS